MALALTEFLARLASPKMRQGWLHAAHRLLGAQSPETRLSLGFLEPVCAVLEGGEKSLLDPLPPEQREFALTIHTSADALRSVLDDILDFSKIESGHLELERAPFDVERNCAEVVALLGASAREKGLALELHWGPGSSPHVIGDALRLRQVVLNLVGNAIKFTECGHVRLSAACAESGQGMRRVRVAVEDTGIGIAPEAQARVFEQFLQADGSTTRRFGGTGLGLAIAKWIADAHHIVLSVASIEGEGSTFSAEFPLSR